MREEALLFGTTESLVGILTEAPEARRIRELPAVILLNAGLVHRVGPNRLYVSMARDLAAQGFAVLRFDFSGVGDSGVRRDHLPFDRSSVSETQEAMDLLEAKKGIQDFVLVGLCSGATASFATACSDRRVRGVVLVNPRNHLHNRADDALTSYLRERALTRHYWRLALFSSFGAKNALRALRGTVDHHRVFSLMVDAPLRRLFSRRKSPSLDMDRLEELRLLAERGVRLLHVYSEGDEGLDYFRLLLGSRLRQWTKFGSLELRIVPGANHTFTLLWSQDYLLTLVRSWIVTMAQGHQADDIPSRQ